MMSAIGYAWGKLFDERLLRRLASVALKTHSDDLLAYGGGAVWRDLTDAHRHRLVKSIRSEEGFNALISSIGAEGWRLLPMEMRNALVDKMLSLHNDPPMWGIGRIWLTLSEPQRMVAARKALSDPSYASDWISGIGADGWRSRDPAIRDQTTRFILSHPAPVFKSGAIAVWRTASDAERSAFMGAIVGGGYYSSLAAAALIRDMDDDLRANLPDSWRADLIATAAQHAEGAALATLAIADSASHQERAALACAMAGNDAGAIVRALADGLPFRSWIRRLLSDLCAPMFRCVSMTIAANLQRGAPWCDGMDCFFPPNDADSAWRKAWSDARRCIPYPAVWRAPLL